MKSHAIQPGKLYDTMPQMPEKIYPHIELPYEIIKDESKKYQPGEEIRITLCMKLDHIGEHNIGGDLLKSECEEEKKD